MKLIVYADLHHYSGNRETAVFNKTQKLTQYAMPMMDELIDKVNNQFRPDAVINLGDSIQDANNQFHIVFTFLKFKLRKYSVVV